eukprot:3668655-Rhodomonas_salina.1
MELRLWCAHWGGGRGSRDCRRGRHQAQAGPRAQHTRSPCFDKDLGYPFTALECLPSREADRSVVLAAAKR